MFTRLCTYSILLTIMKRCMFEYLNVHASTRLFKLFTCILAVLGLFGWHLEWRHDWTANGLSDVLSRSLFDCIGTQQCISVSCVLGWYFLDWARSKQCECFQF